MPASRRGVQQRLDAVGARNVVLLPYPNRMLRLRVPITTRRGLANGVAVGSMIQPPSMRRWRASASQCIKVPARRLSTRSRH